MPDELKGFRGPHPIKAMLVVVIIVIDHRRCCGRGRDWLLRDDERRFTDERERRSVVGVVPIGSDGWIAATDSGAWFHGSENSRREKSGAAAVGGEAASEPTRMLIGRRQKRRD